MDAVAGNVRVPSPAFVNEPDSSYGASQTKRETITHTDSTTSLPQLQACIRQLFRWLSRRKNDPLSKKIDEPLGKTSSPEGLIHPDRAATC